MSYLLNLDLYTRNSNKILYYLKRPMWHNIGEYQSFPKYSPADISRFLWKYAFSVIRIMHEFYEVCD